MFTDHSLVTPERGCVRPALQVEGLSQVLVRTPGGPDASPRCGHGLPVQTPGQGGSGLGMPRYLKGSCWSALHPRWALYPAFLPQGKAWSEVTPGFCICHPGLKLNFSWIFTQKNVVLSDALAGTAPESHQPPAWDLSRDPEGAWSLLEAGRAVGSPSVLSAGRTDKN